MDMIQELNYCLGTPILFLSSLAGCMHPWLPTLVFHHYGHSAQFIYALSLAAMTKSSAPSLCSMPPAASWLLLPASFSLCVKYVCFVSLLVCFNVNHNLLNYFSDSPMGHDP